jgi:hypothetical protein
MCVMTIDGLAFRVASPSCYELIHSWPDVLIFLMFNGVSWAIRYSDASHGVTRYFKTRDEAIALLVDRRAA